MKNITKIFLLALSLYTVSCTDENIFDNRGQRITTLYVKEIFYNEVTAQADMENPSGIVETGFLVSDIPGVDPATAIVYVSDSDTDSINSKRFKAYINNLTINKDYYLKAYALENNGHYYYGQEIVFRTSSNQIDYVTMKVPDELYDNNSMTAKSLEVYGSVSDLGGGGQRLMEYGAYYWPKDMPEMKLKKSVIVSIEEPIAVNELFSVPLSGLAANTTYQIQVYARNVRREQYLNPFEITTLEVTTPEIEYGTTPVEVPTSTTVKTNFKIKSFGNDPEAEYGVYFGTVLPLVQKMVATETDENGNFMVFIRGLNAATQYYVQGYVKNDHSEVRTAVSNPFTTLPAGKPMIETTPFTTQEEITTTSAILRALIFSDGGSPLTKYGFKYGTSEASLTNFIQATKYDTIAGKYSATLSNLLPNTEYYFAASAENVSGEVLGNTFRFKTGILGELQWVWNGTAIVSGSEQMIYFELDPVSVTIQDFSANTSRNAKLYFLDRNLGAKERYPNCSDDIDADKWGKFVGYYYKWGNEKPDLVYSPAAAAVFITGNGTNIQAVGWRNTDDSAPVTAKSWPESANPCPEGYHVPSLFEWQAFSRAVAAQGENNGDFADVFRSICLGKTGYRQKAGTLGAESDNQGLSQTTRFLGYLWSSTPTHTRPFETLNNVYQIGSNPPVLLPSLTIDNSSFTTAYHFGVTTSAWVLPRVGNSYILATQAIDSDPSNDILAYTTSKSYDKWQFYGINDRDMRAGMPVRCVRTVYE